MTVELGVKSDPILYRYSFEWLFDLMSELGVVHLQLGTWFEMYWLPDSYFRRLRATAEQRGISIRSCFTSHRELGGLLDANMDVHRVAMERYKRFIEIGAVVGAESVGSNPGSVLRDRMEGKPDSINRYLDSMDELRNYAKTTSVGVLTLEPMSSLGEPPTTKAEITTFMKNLNPADSVHDVPVYLCSDLSHGLADETGQVVESNLELLESAIPWMWEFHIKNTDSRFDSTFGFGPADAERGIVDLGEVARIISTNAPRFPTDRLVGYLELPGPKLGRDYSDGLLEGELRDSIEAIRERFFPALALEN